MIRAGTLVLVSVDVLEIIGVAGSGMAVVLGGIVVVVLLTVEVGVRLEAEPQAFRVNIASSNKATIALFSSRFCNFLAYLELLFSAITEPKFSAKPGQGILSSRPHIFVGIVLGNGLKQFLEVCYPGFG